MSVKVSRNFPEISRGNILSWICRHPVVGGRCCPRLTNELEQWILSPRSLQGDHWAWKLMEFRKTIFQAWIVMENSKGHGKSSEVMEKSRIMSWNFYNCTEKFCNECEQWVCRHFSLLQPAGTVTTNSGMHLYVMFRLFRQKYRGADRSWKFIFVVPGKVMENDFPKRVVTLPLSMSCSQCLRSLHAYFAPHGNVAVGDTDHSVE